MGVLHLGDNLPYLEAMAPGVVQLAYADPPFGTNKDRRAEGGRFEDRWAGAAEYVAWLRPRVGAIRRALAASGTLYLHLDRRSVHHARLLLDDVFGERCFGNEIIWHYTGGGRGARRELPAEDTPALRYPRLRRFDVCPRCLFRERDDWVMLCEEDSALGRPRNFRERW